MNYLLQLIGRYADMFAALGTESRLRVMHLLISAHPQGMVAECIRQELQIPADALFEHLEKLKNEELVRVRIEAGFPWYSANLETVQEIVAYLYSDCCARNKWPSLSELIDIETVRGSGSRCKND